MLDHMILTVSNVERSLAFYEVALKPLNIKFFLPYKGEGNHPDLWGFGDGKRAFFWIKQGKPDPTSIHWGFMAENNGKVDECFGTLVRLFCSHHGLLLENLALRQQLVVLKRRHPRPRLNLRDRFFWLLVCRCCSGWKQALLVVKPETVVRWHHAGFRWYWKMISKVTKPIGRRQTSKEVRDLIFQMVAENPSWGAPRIHGELLMLGFDVSERTVSRWMKRAPGDPDPAKRWLAFLRNHREADRTHLGLGKEMPNCRAHSKASGLVLSQERLGELHHRYDRAA
jgi:hypothetical protein